MQIVIDIPEDVYERFGHEYREENLISKYTSDVILEAFCKGTLLSKGHGRLIDVSEYFKKEFGDAREFLDKATTIIEADKAESEES